MSARHRENRLALYAAAVGVASVCALVVMRFTSDRAEIAGFVAQAASHSKEALETSEVALAGLRLPALQSVDLPIAADHADRVSSADC